MDKRIDKLANFIEQYAEEYLEYETKKDILKRLNEGDEKLALEIMSSMDRAWIDRTREIRKFRIFTDCRKVHAAAGTNTNKKNCYQTSYMDEYSNSSENNIPTLKYIVYRTIDEVTR